MKSRIPRKRQKNQVPAPKGDELIRLNRFIANAGVCSRREADTLICDGRISVNGTVVKELGVKVKPGDEVLFRGKRLNPEKNVYLLLNKPKGYICTVRDERSRKTVMDLIKGSGAERLFPVGRLDKNTTGLLLLTNDGELTKVLTHPSHKVRKVYRVTLNNGMSDIDIGKMRSGFELEDGFIRADDVSRITGGAKNEIGIELHSGRNRIVRRMFEFLGYRVIKLDRVLFANLTKKDLPRGKWRKLTQLEISNLKRFPRIKSE